MNPAYKPTPFIPSASDYIARHDALRSGPQIVLPANSHHRALGECQAPRSRLTRRRQLQSGLVQIEPTKPRRE
jgi:hypothetical protein